MKFVLVHYVSPGVHFISISSCGIQYGVFQTMVEGTLQELQALETLE